MKYLIISVVCYIGFVFLMYHIHTRRTPVVATPSSYTCIDPTIDIVSDASIQKYVGRDIPFNTIDYRPDDLVYLSGTTIAANGSMQLREEAALTLLDLSQSFYAAFSQPLTVVSAYRSYSRQQTIAAGCKEIFCARPGYSEHQGWLTVDFFMFANVDAFFADPDRQEYYDRLMDNAHTFGWHNSYQKGSSIDGYVREPWHWRYVWIDLATHLWENKLTFTECVNMDRALGHNEALLAL